MTDKLNRLFKRWEQFTNLERDRMGHKREYRLDRMEQLCELFGHPEKACRYIHIAGSKGKGSTAVLCASILEQEGNRVGLYSSPHLIDYTERFRLFPASDEDESLLAELGQLIDKKVSGLPEGTLAGGDIPTTFEMLTLLAFLYFSETECRWVLLETGLGGRLDATNVVFPEAVILTPIELEHQEFLGDTLEKIAGEKAGIIKTGIPVFSAFQKPEVFRVFEKTCRIHQSRFHPLADYLLSSAADPDGLHHRLNWKKLNLPREISLSMTGPVQGMNAALALLCIRTIMPSITEKSLLDGLSRGVLPGRGQIIQKDPLILLDGAHTPSSMENMKTVLRQMGKGPYYLLFGCASDKDPVSIGSVLQGGFDGICVTTPGTFKRSDPSVVCSIFQGMGLPAEVNPQTEEALEELFGRLDDGGSLLIAGSFYLAGIAAEWFIRRGFRPSKVE